MYESLLTTATLISLITVLWLAVQLAFARRQRRKLPPGPIQWPIIGNILDFPQDKRWLTLADWARTYGDMTYVNLFGTKVIIVNSPSVLSAMFDGKSAIYSHRPSLTFAKLAGWHKNFALMDPGPELTHQRRLLAQAIGSKASISKMQPMIDEQVLLFVKDILSMSRPLFYRARTMAGSVVLAITYGYTVEGPEDKFIRMADRMLHDLELAMVPGKWLVDSVPLLRFMPSWFPLAGFKKIAAAMQKDRLQMLEEPYNFVMDGLADGNAKPSLVERHVQGKKISEQEEERIKWAAAVLYLAGTDTTGTIVHAMLVCLLMYPEVQKRAQAEVDAVTMQDHLPTAQDQVRMPYVEACWKEVLRFHSVAPEGIAHRAAQDDVHDGNYIPKGAVIMPNIWWFCHDPSVYADPHTFRPERFLGDKPEPDPREYVFGTGRRVCSGQRLAENVLFRVITIVLAVVNIIPAKDSTGQVIPVGIEVQGSGLVSTVKEVPLHIHPRSEKTLLLLDDALSDL